MLNKMHLLTGNIRRIAVAAAKFKTSHDAVCSRGMGYITKCLLQQSSRKINKRKLYELSICFITGVLYKFCNREKNWQKEFPFLFFFIVNTDNL